MAVMRVVQCCADAALKMLLCFVFLPLGADNDIGAAKPHSTLCHGSNTCPKSMVTKFAPATFS
ncbi:MAG: hypothetical protein ACO37E_02155, partial [Lutimaribacter sp.]